MTLPFYGALNFKAEFVPAIELGRKRMSIRAERKDLRVHAKVDHQTKLFDGMHQLHDGLLPLLVRQFGQLGQSGFHAAHDFFARSCTAFTPPRYAQRPAHVEAPAIFEPACAGDIDGSNAGVAQDGNAVDAGFG